MNVANPIYDAVFKYLMEDLRVARTVLSALLKRDVVEVEVRKHEYANESRDKISMFRIDFGATIKQDDGSDKLVLIELQKTWLETETLRFRQYLGTQYSNPANMVSEPETPAYGLPMVTVYLLGHRVGDIEEPVIYVKHKAYNYYDEEVVKGVPDPFIESLVHDSIIVQIPLLHGRINNRLDKVLSVFNQSNTTRSNRQILDINEEIYGGDADMLHLLRRLAMAAGDAKLRQDMNVEEEYYSAIESRDTAIMTRDKKIEEQQEQLAEQQEQLAEKDGQLAEQQEQLAEKDGQLAEQQEQLAEKDGQLAEQQEQLAEKDGQLAEQQEQLAEKDGQLAEQRNALVQSARAMKEAGMPVEMISQITGIAVEQIENL